MCGRYASSRKPGGPRRGVRDRQGRGPRDRSCRTTTSRPPSRCTPWSSGPRSSEDTTGRSERQLRVAELGPGAVLGQGPLDRQPDDQRADGDRRTRSRPSGGRSRPGAACSRPTATTSGTPPSSGPRPGKPRQAAVLHPPRRRRRAGDGRALRDLARPRPATRTTRTRFRWTCTVLTTTAEDAVGHIHDRMPLLVEPRAVRRLARPAVVRRPRSSRGAAGARRARPARGLPGVHRWSTTSATTGPSCSTRCRRPSPMPAMHRD